MTSLVDTGRRTGWRARLVWIALALSLTLNVFFVGGLLWVRINEHPFLPPLERIEHFVRPLGLTADQHTAFEQFLRVIRLHGRFTRETDRSLQDQIWIEIARPSPDDSTLARLTDQVYASREAFQKEASGALMDFIKTLTPAQRAKMARLVRRPADEATRRLFYIVVP